MSGNNNSNNGNAMAALFASQAQGQLQAEAQGQGQGQLQAAIQDQDQGQGQSQGQSQHSYNESDNGNLNGNINDNINTVDTTVTSAVNVTVGVNGEWAAPSEMGTIHLDNLNIDHLDGSFFVMPDFSAQTLNGDGNIFNLDQVNSLVDNDYLSSPSVSLGLGGLESYCGPEGTLPTFNFTQNATGTGGDAAINNSLGGDHGTSGAVSSANAVTAEAFTQHITQGANIQYNSMPVSVVGGDSFSEISGTADSGSNL